MDQHYSAFISYKHAPADTAVASEIQKRLERFHIPAPIRKKTGKERVGRIFRDKEELPITSDLSKDISEALTDADYLIVICSTSTRLSTWVSREIDFFLKTHNRKQVLTVIVDGEPSEVIPKQLFRNTVSRNLENVNTLEEEMVYEPLSCDFRIGFREARRTEIPRLAAAILGCKYDELIMRERQYKRRRNMAIGIPAACIAAVAVAYLCWSRQEISRNYQRAEENYRLAEKNYQKAEENYQLAQENYREAQENLNQALVNQSYYLASESKKLYEKGDRLGAILLAMEALPDHDAGGDSPSANRPVTAVAQMALTKALHAYEQEASIPITDGLAMTAKFNMEGDIADFKETLDGRYVVVRDSCGNAGVWDSVTLSRILLLDQETILDICLASDTQIVTLSDIGVTSYDIPSGQELWRYEEEDVNWLLSKMCLSEKGEIVWVGESLGAMEESLWEDGNAKSYGMKLLGIDAPTGKVVSETMLAENEQERVLAQQMACSEDGRWVAAAIRRGIRFGVAEKMFWLEDIVASDTSGEEQYFFPSDVPVQVFLLDAESGTDTELSLNREYSKIDTMLFAKDRTGETDKREESVRLAVMGYPLRKNEQDGQNSVFGGRKAQIILSCYNPVSAAVIWEENYFSSQIPKLPSGKSLFFLEESQNLVSLYANKAVVIRISDGEIMEEAETTASIVSGGIDSDQSVRLFLENGDLGRYYADDPGGLSRLEQISFFHYDLKSAGCIHQAGRDGNAYMVVSEPKSVWLCQAVYDDPPVKYPGDALPASAYSVCLLGDTAAVLDDYEKHLYLYDLSEQAFEKDLELSDRSGMFVFLDADEASGLIWLYNEFLSCLLAVDISDCTIKEYRNKAGNIIDPRLMPDGSFVYWICDHSDNRLVTASAAGGVLEEKVLMSFSGTLSDISTSIRPDLRYAVMMNSAAAELDRKPVFQIADLDTGERKELLQVLPKGPVQVVWQETGSENANQDPSAGSLLAATDGYEAVILDTDGTGIIRLSQWGSQVVNMASYNGELIVYYSGGLLMRYSWDGTMLGSSRVLYDDRSETGIFDEKTVWDFEGDRLYLIRGGGEHLQIIDLDSWEEEANVQWVLGYDKVRDRIITGCYDWEDGSEYLSYYPHYTVEDLRRKAKEVLHGTELTCEEKEVYGLE